MTEVTKDTVVADFLQELTEKYSTPLTMAEVDKTMNLHDAITIAIDLSLLGEVTIISQTQHGYFQVGMVLSYPNLSYCSFNGKRQWSHSLGVTTLERLEKLGEIPLDTDDWYIENLDILLEKMKRVQGAFEKLKEHCNDYEKSEN